MNLISGYNKLNEIVGQQIKESRESMEEMQLLRSIKQKIEFVKANPFYGNNIPKKTNSETVHCQV